jgi:hypothetical protein
LLPSYWFSSPQKLHQINNGVTIENVRKCLVILRLMRVTLEFTPR